jgi:hypothetical protein
VKIDCHTLARSRAAGPEPPKMWRKDVVKSAPRLKAEGEQVRRRHEAVPVVFVALEEQVVDDALIERDLGGRRLHAVRQAAAQLGAKALDEGAQRLHVRTGGGGVGVRMPDQPARGKRRPQRPPFQLDALGQKRIAVGKSGDRLGDGVLVVVEQAHAVTAMDRSSSFTREAAPQAG